MALSIGSYNVLQARTTLVIDAITCGVLDGATCFIPVWSRRRIRWPKPNDVPSVRFPRITIHVIHMILAQVARTKFETE